MKRVRMMAEVYPTNMAQDRWGGEGQTLGDCLAVAKNGVLAVGDPYGETHMVSLAPFDGADPNHFLMFRFVEFPEENDNFHILDHGNGVVLKDYKVPDNAAEPEVTRPPIGDGSFLKKYNLPPGTAMLS
jgi:hypothetical protein